MEQALKNIIKFNIDKGLSKQGINVKRGASFILEELMEMFEESLIPREAALRMIENEKAFKTPKEDMRIILDSYGDIIVFAIGEMFKTLIGLGNSEEDATKLISIIMRNITEANLKKCLEQDKEGKLMKGERFEAPKIPLNIMETNLYSCYKAPSNKEVYLSFGEVARLSEHNFNKNRDKKDISQESFGNLMEKLEECIEETIKEEELKKETNSTNS